MSHPASLQDHHPVNQASKGPVHRPYLGASTPFSIGLIPLDLADWIEPDDQLGFYLDEKRRLHAEDAQAVFVEHENSLAAQAETLSLLSQFLPERFPQIYQRSGTGMQINAGGAERLIDLDQTPPLLAATNLVQEDLILMQKGEDGWQLAAGSLSFPSSWSLQEKFSRSITQIHEPVPDFDKGSRNDELITRMFDRFQPGNPVQRFNWSLQADDGLSKPLVQNIRVDGTRNRFPLSDILAGTYIRVERQTLRKLPQSGAILFTIRIHVDPLSTFAQIPDGRDLAMGLATQLAALDERQLAYKGYAADRDRLVAALRAI